MSEGSFIAKIACDRCGETREEEIERDNRNPFEHRTCPACVKEENDKRQAAS